MDDRPDTTPAPAAPASATGALAGAAHRSGRPLRRIVIAVAVLLLLLLAWIAAGPWLAIRGIEKAIETRDTAALERHVDFPTLRANVRAKVAKRLLASATSPSGRVVGETEVACEALGERRAHRAPARAAARPASSRASREV